MGRASRGLAPNPRLRRPALHRWAHDRGIQVARRGAGLASVGRAMLKVERATSARGSPMVDARPTVFFSKTYDEALGLLEAARAYLSLLEPIDRRGLAMPERLRLCSETLRMTARLTQIIAW